MISVWVLHDEDRRLPLPFVPSRANGSGPSHVGGHAASVVDDVTVQHLLAVKLLLDEPGPSPETFIEPEHERNCNHEKLFTSKHVSEQFCEQLL